MNGITTKGYDGYQMEFIPIGSALDKYSERELSGINAYWAERNRQYKAKRFSRKDKKELKKRKVWYWKRRKIALIFQPTTVADMEVGNFRELFINSEL